MRLPLKRLERRARQLAGEAAELAGHVARLVKSSGPGALGAVSITYGLGEIYSPLLWLAAGGFLLLLDRDT